MQALSTKMQAKLLKCRHSSTKEKKKSKKEEYGEEYVRRWKSNARPSAVYPYCFERWKEYPVYHEMIAVYRIVSGSRHRTGLTGYGGMVPGKSNEEKDKDGHQTLYQRVAGREQNRGGTKKRTNHRVVDGMVRLRRYENLQINISPVQEAEGR